MNSLINLVQLPFSCCRVLLENRAFVISCITSLAVSILGAYYLCRRSSRHTSNLKNYIVITPIALKKGTFTEGTQTEKRSLYFQAKKIIQALPNNFKSRVKFNDRNLEIGFRYSKTTLTTLAGHEKLWFILSGEESYKPYTNNDTILDGVNGRFRVKDLMEASFQFGKEKEALKKRAQEFFSSEVRIKKTPNHTQIGQFGNYTEIFPAFLKKSKGISFGDFHSHIASKFVLFSQMKTLVAHNVEVLFMEGIDPELQGDLDTYFHPKTDVKDMPLSIQYRFGHLEARLSSKGGYTMLDIIREAKICGIKRIVGIDSGLCDGDDQTRISTMNYFAKQVIDRNMPRGKYVIFSGASHAMPNSGTKIPSFSQLLGIPSILVSDGRVTLFNGKCNSEFTYKSDGYQSVTMHPTFHIQLGSHESRKKTLSELS